jgi:replicative DNA helicase
MFKSLTSILSEIGPEFRPVAGYQTGYPPLDSMIGGISETDLVLIAEKSGGWSGILLLNLAVEMSRQYPVLLINTRKKASAVANDLKSVLLPKHETEDTDEDTLNDLNQLANNIFIAHNSHFLEEIEQVIADFHLKNPANGIILIDDLNKIFLSKEITTCPRTHVESEIATNLKMLILKYNHPVFLLSKIGYRDAVTRSYPPTLTDMDYLDGLNRPFNKIMGVYQARGDQNDDDQDLCNKLFLNILRNDNGPKGDIGFAFNESNRYRFDNSWVVY